MPNLKMPDIATPWHYTTLQQIAQCHVITHDRQSESQQQRCALCNNSAPQLWRAPSCVYLVMVRQCVMPSTMFLMYSHNVTTQSKFVAMLCRTLCFWWIFTMCLFSHNVLLCYATRYVSDVVSSFLYSVKKCCHVMPCSMFLMDSYNVSLCYAAHQVSDGVTLMLREATGSQEI